MVTPHASDTVRAGRTGRVVTQASDTEGRFADHRRLCVPTEVCAQSRNGLVVPSAGLRKSPYPLSVPEDLRGTSSRVSGVGLKHGFPISSLPLPVTFHTCPEE